MKHLRDLPNLTELIGTEIAVNLKIDQAALVLKKDEHGLHFYGREGAREIDYVKRTGIDLYEKPIQYLESKPWHKLANGTEIFLEIFDPRLPSIVKYENVPEPGIYLSYAKNGGVVMPPGSIETHMITALLNVHEPPLVFVGTFAPGTQAKIITEYREEPTRLIDMMRHGFYSAAGLVGVKREWDEGLVFFFGDRARTIGKLIDPRFGEALIDKIKPDIYRSTLERFVLPLSLDRAEHLLAKLGPYRGLEPQKAYVEFIEGLLHTYMHFNAARLHFILNDYREHARRFLSVNKKHLSKQTLSYFQEYWWAEDLFRILLFALERTGKRLTGEASYHKREIDAVTTSLKVRGYIEPEEARARRIEALPFKLDDYPKPQKRPGDVMVGRFQPFHKGHYEALKNRKNPVVVIVRGDKSRQDIIRNPIDDKWTAEIIHKMIPDAMTVVAKSAYIPEIFRDLRKNGVEPSTLLAGPDRIQDYKRQVDEFNFLLPADKRFNVTVKETKRIVAATDVRNAVGSGNIKTFRKLMPKALWKTWDEMRSAILG